MEARQKSSKSAGEFGAAICLVLLLVASIACCKAKSFPRREALPLGPYRLSILYVEAEQSRQGKLLLSVYFRFRQVAERRRGLMGRLVGTGPSLPRFTIIDSRGKEYFPALIDYGQAEKDSVITFSVPLESRGFTARINNPEPRKGQPCAVAVPLGR